MIRDVNTTHSSGVETFRKWASRALLSVRSRRRKMKCLDVQLVFIIIVLFPIQFPRIQWK